ncbi:hypothetical protein U1Q18_034725 [Sarracenia purpurea var. burkii]
MPPTAMMQRRSGPFPFSLQLLPPSLALNFVGLTIDGWVWWKRGGPCQWWRYGGDAFWAVLWRRTAAPWRWPEGSLGRDLSSSLFPHLLLLHGLICFGSSFCGQGGPPILLVQWGFYPCKVAWVSWSLSIPPLGIP